MGDALISRTLKNSNVNIVQETGTSTTSIMSQSASTNSFAMKNHSHAVSDLTSGTLSVSRGGTGQTTLSGGAILLGNGTSGITSTSTLPINKGGTGSTTASGSLNNLGLPKESGNWTPSINATSVSYNTRSGRYYRIGDMVYIACYINMVISNAGSNYAKISGLPFSGNTGLKAGFNMIDTGNLNMIPDSGSTVHARLMNSWGGTNVSIYTADGSTAQRWSTGSNKYLVFSGWYLKA